jgi:hypothetical protein
MGNCDAILTICLVVERQWPSDRNDGLWTLTFGEKATPQVLYFTTV